MVQDIFPHILRNEFSSRPALPDDFVVAFQGDAILMRAEGGVMTLPTLRDLPAGGGPHATQYLFAEDERGFYLLESEAPAPFGPWAYVSTQTYRDYGPRQTLFACAVAETLHRWYTANRFCGRCGREMVKSRTERAMVCPNCGNTVYPKICPAVIVAVTDGNRLLLTKYAGRSIKRYALIAGFNEIGEGIESTVRREVMEEVGLRVTDLRFYKSQPWAFTDTLLMGFYARLDGGDRVRLQEDELALAEWFDREKLPDDFSAISLTGEMIEAFRQGKDPYSIEKKLV